MPYALVRKNIGLEEMERDLPRYHNRIDESKLTIIQDIEADYKRRQGNLVLKLAKYIKPEIYEKPRFGKLKPSDTEPQTPSCDVRRKIKSLFGKFLRSFGEDSELLERDFPAGCRKSKKKWRKSANRKTEKDRR